MEIKPVPVWNYELHPSTMPLMLRMGETWQVNGSTSTGVCVSSGFISLRNSHCPSGKEGFHRVSTNVGDIYMINNMIFIIINVIITWSPVVKINCIR
jgi:hypothetical protein